MGIWSARKNESIKCEKKEVGEKGVGDVKRKKWVKWYRRKVEEEIREKGRMEGKKHEIWKTQKEEERN